MLSVNTNTCPFLPTSPIFLFVHISHFYPYSLFPDMTLSFEFSSYTVNESQRILPVNIVREPRDAETEISAELRPELCRYQFLLGSITRVTIAIVDDDEREEKEKKGSEEGTERGRGGREQGREEGGE